MATVGEQILTILDTLARGAVEGLADALSVFETARASVQVVAQGVAAASTEQAINEVRATYMETPLTPAVLADMAIRNIATPFDKQQEAALSGLNAERFDALVTETGESYGIIDALRLWHRGTYLYEIVDTSATGSGQYPFVFGKNLGTELGITKDELDKVIYYSRVRDEFIPDLLKLSWATMTPADAVEVAIKGRMSPDDARTLYQAAGGLPDQFDLLYAAAGDSMGVETAVMLNHRGYITDTELEDVLYQSRINPRFYPLVKLQYLHFLAPYQIAQALRSGVIGPDTANKWMLEAGYPADQAAAFASTEAAGSIHTAKAETEGMILADYEAGIISDTEATSALKSLGYVETAIPFILQSMLARREVSMRNAAITRLRAAYIAWAVDEQTVRQDLSKLGIPVTAQDVFLTAWGIERSTPHKMLTMAQVGKLYEEGLMNAEQAFSYWGNLGYNETDVQWLAQIYPGGSKAVAATTPPPAGSPGTPAATGG